MNARAGLVSFGALLAIACGESSRLDARADGSCGGDPACAGRGGDASGCPAAGCAGAAGSGSDTSAGPLEPATDRDASGAAQDASIGPPPDAAAHDASAADGGRAIADGAAADAGAEMTGPICPLESGDYAAPGPHQVATMQVDLGTVASIEHATATFYYPTPLQDDCLHAIIAWGNGTGVQGTATYEFYHQRAASWGFVVAAPHSDLIAEGGGVQKAAVDYLMQENGRPGSIFHRRLHANVGTAGHAQGAYAAALLAESVAVRAQIAIDGPIPRPDGVPLLCLTGTEGLQECVPNASSAAGPAFIASWQDADHVTTPTVTGFEAMNAGTMQFLRLYTAWFRCFLAEDATACALFEGGADCGLCREQNAGWSALQSRNL